MSVQNGQAVSAAVTNAAFVSRTQDTSAAGVVNLEKELLLNNLGSTPSNPASGKTKLYSKGDGRIYFLLPDGTEKLVGANELNDLENVLIGTPAIGEVLTWDGSNWVNLPGGSGGGGGIPVLWQQFNSAPIEREENNAAVYEYEPGLTQNLFCDIRVPDSYLAGVQLRLKGIFKTDATTGNVLMEAQSTLIRIGVDQSGSTTNQHNSTNTAITVPGTARVITEVELDLTDSVGEVNGVAVGPGDKLRVRLRRGTDTATENVFVFKTSWEVLLS